MNHIGSERSIYGHYDHHIPVILFYEGRSWPVKIIEAEETILFNYFLLAIEKLSNNKKRHRALQQDNNFINVYNTIFKKSLFTISKGVHTVFIISHTKNCLDVWPILPSCFWACLYWSKNRVVWGSWVQCEYNNMK